MDQKKNVLREGFDGRCLTRFLRGCPKLDKVEITADLGTKIMSDVVNLAFRECMATPTWTEPILEAGVHQAVTTIKAIHAAQTNLRALSVVSVAHRILSENDEMTTACSAVMRSLHELTIGTRCEFDLLKHHPSFRRELRRAMKDMIEHYGNGVLHSWLVIAVELRYLKLTMAILPALGPCADMLNIIGDITWEHLKELTLSGCLTTIDFLATTLLRQPGLRSLSLTMIRLVDGSWGSFFEKVGEKLCNLRSVKLRYKFQEMERDVFYFGKSGIVNQRVDLVRDAAESMILNGGELPDSEALENDPQHMEYPLPGYVPTTATRT